MSAVLGSTPAVPASRWRLPLATLLGLWLLLGLLYRDTLVAMVTIWQRSDTFAHCFLVPPICLWLAWRQRARLQALTPSPQPWLLAGLALLAVFWLGADIAGVNAATQAALVAMIVLAVPALLGLRVARAFAFPLLFAFFMVPFGEFMTPQLMAWTADFTVAALRMSGIPVYREGMNFIIPSGSWSVVEACSGVRYMMASFMVGTLFAYLNYVSLKRRLLFCAVSLLVPLVANWLRAYMIVMLGHLSGNTIAVGVDHLVYGWLFFGVVIGAMFFIGARWAEHPADVSLPAGGAAGGGSLSSPRLLAVAAAAGLIAAAPHGVSAHFERQARDGGAVVLKLDAIALPEAAGPGFEPALHNPNASVLRSFGFDGGVVTVHVGYYRHQGYGHKLVSSQNQLVASDDKRWRRVSGGSAVHAGQGWRSAELGEGYVGAGGRAMQRLDVRQVYWADGQLTASDARAALRSLAGRLLGRGDDAALITVYTAGDNPAATGARLARFIEQQLPALQAQLQAARARR